MSLDLDYVRKAAEFLVNVSREMPSNEKPEKAGGYLLVGLDNLSTREILEIGRCDPQKLDKYWAIVQEKAHRLYADWLRDPTSVLSWQTRDPDMNQWGGGVLFPILGEGRQCNIISFSGLTEAADEAVSLILGLPLKFADRAYLDVAAKISDNVIYREMAQRLNL